MNDLISLEKIAQWQRLKTLVLDSVSSPITKRVYNMALDEFMSWFQQAPRSGFRDTLAVELLLAGVLIERISILLGHSSVKITERHYAPWVQARQTQLESDLKMAWRNDPIAQAETLRGDTATRDGAPL